jgi:glycerate kinase
MAQASGLERLGPEERDPTRTSTRGTGQLIRTALDAGVARIIVGIGGSATVDGGAGMAIALGARLLDAEGKVLHDCPGGRVGEVRSIDLSGLHPAIADVEIVVASDVTNPLLGPDGAARTYGPQKGATPEEVELLERALSSLERVFRRDLARDVRGMQGAGAAGGLGAGLVAFLGARIERGALTVAEAVGLRRRMAGSDLVFTAEGRMDGQSSFGKATACVAALAREAGVPAVGLAGSLGPGYRRLYDSGFAALVPIVDGPITLEEALERAESLLEGAAEQVIRIWLASAAKRNG